MISQRKQIRFFWPVIVLLIIAIAFGLNSFYFQRADNADRMSEINVLDILSSITTDDLIAMVFWDKDNSEHLWKEIIKEKRKGLRDEERIDNESKEAFKLVYSSSIKWSNGLNLKHEMEKSL